jgi:hypothetical protein
MTADLHDQLNRRAGQEFIGAKGAAGGMRSDPVLFGFYDLNTFVSFFVGEFNSAVQCSQFANGFNMPVEFRIGKRRYLFFKLPGENMFGFFA